MPYYLTPKQDDFNQELQVCLATARIRQRLLFRNEGPRLINSITGTPAYRRALDYRLPRRFLHS